MEIRLNKLISDSGLCSRREADRFIEAGRVTVNGRQPLAGAKVTGTDVVMLDGLRIDVKDYGGSAPTRATQGKAGNLIFGAAASKVPASNRKPANRMADSRIAFPEETGATGDGPKREKYGRYNKYAAARKAAKAGKLSPFAGKSPEERQKEKILRDALQPKFGRSMSKGAIAQRLAAAPKSAALRKTSKNNPANKARRAAGRNSRNGRPEQEE